MRFYGDNISEKIGYDFYCDIAINIVNKRKELGLTQEELAKKATIKLSRLSKIENVQYRIRLGEIELLAKALDVTVNNLINSGIDSQAGDCRYLVYIEGYENFKLYSDACNKRMAFLKLEKKLNDQGRTWFSTPRTRVLVELIGIPVVKQELEDKLPKFKEDQEIEK
jgi:transcriptional regulator with XRE-family HTH domain